jgi:4-amino-4-deoxy-L-arabinose transferase-like glycosyltransferase
LFGVDNSRLKGDVGLRLISTWLILAAIYVLLVGGYIAAIPPQQSIDEGSHFQYVQNLIRLDGLPVVRPDDGPEAFEPPLYYASTAVVSSLAEHLDLNGRFAISKPLLELLIGRVLSAIAGLVTIWSVWQLTGLVFPRQTVGRMLATALVAFDPTFLSVSASVTNDSFAAAFGSLAILAAAETAARGLSTRRTILGGVAVGLGVLTKLSTLATLAPLVLAIALIYAKRRELAASARQIALLGATVLAVAGWWWWRSWSLYGDPTGRRLQAMLNPGMVRTAPIPIAEYPSHVGDLLRTYLAAVGPNGSIRLPELAYDVWFGLLLLGLLGLLTLAARHRSGMPADPRARVLAVAGVAVVASGVALVVAAQSIEGLWHGRLLLPVSAPIAVLLTVGLYSLGVPRRASSFAIGGGLVALAVTVPLVSLAPIRSSTTLPAAAARDVQFPIDATYAGAMRLVGSSVTHETVPAGDRVQVTLYWETVGSVDDEWTVYVHLDDNQQHTVAQWDGFPCLPMRYWRPEQLYAQPIELAIPDGLLPGVYTLKAGLYRKMNGQLLRPSVQVDASSSSATEPLAGIVKIAGGALERPTTATQVEFQDGIELAGWDWSQGKLTLTWQSAGTPAKQYTVFVHLLDGDGRLVAQNDGPPANGNFPTEEWGPGDVVIDPHPLAAPPGSYQVEVGLYDSQTHQRLPVVNGSDRVLLAEVTVGSIDGRNGV